MIKSIHGVTNEPFNRNKLTLLSQQKEILDIIKIHAQQGGFSVIVGEPGVGKTVLKEHIEQLDNQRDITVASCSITLHTYWQILTQLANSFKLDVPEKSLKNELIKATFNHIKQRKTLYILVDEAHLLDMQVLR